MSTNEIINKIAEYQNILSKRTRGKYELFFKDNATIQIGDNVIISGIALGEKTWFAVGYLEVSNAFFWLSFDCLSDNVLTSILHLLRKEI